ncbi:uncharacterized protein LOC122080630 isoform X2 [Macadamia integrifolia]|uniref:uncharacterized protein LOC122080630 isoform X2 n=1 Tax=Macadamia integrifolia TaxID=60698 RepID=UPI001C4F684A|nr:uncharacterized protein LOC122080630 isoform X2 [Macadamia integrifolia]
MTSGLVDLVFSWSLRDVLNEQLFKTKVKKIPKTFLSAQHYLTSYIFPLIEETHADLRSSIMDLSQAPKYQIDHVEESDDHEPPRDLFYDMVVVKEGDGKHDKEIYELQVGDLIALSDVKPRCIDDLNKGRRSYLLALVTAATIADIDGGSSIIKVLSSKVIMFEQDVQKQREPLFAFFLTNMTTNIRIWKALHPDMKEGNMNIIKEVLCTDSTVGVDCELCLLSQDDRIRRNYLLTDLQTLNLNESQSDALIRSIATKNCNHKSSVKLIWGPPGTGKTKMVGALLWVLLRMKCRTLTCTPTNIALMEVTSRLLKLVRESLQHHNYGLGDIVLSGNEERMKIKERQDLHDVFLDYRARELSKCFAPLSGWNHQLNSMIPLLEDAGHVYLFYLEEKKKEKLDVSQNERKKDKNTKEKEEDSSKGKTKEKRKQKIARNLKEGKRKHIRQEKILAQESKQLNCLEPEYPPETMITEGQEDGKKDVLTIEVFIKKRFTDIQMDLRFFIVTLCKHLPTSFLSVRVVEVMIKALHFLESLGTLLHGSVTNEELKCVFVDSEDLKTTVCGSNTLLLDRTRNDCLKILKSLREAFSVPNFMDKHAIRNFCLQHAYLIFSTVSRSAKLHSDERTPLELLVIDEAAQLKECESAIPLQLPGVRHAILIGDERQLPAMVRSKISEKAEFGRSLFERLVSLGQKKHLLNVQYRMHPSISVFPNTQFYRNQILDAPSVKERSHERHFLQGNMYGPYSFINVAYGREELDGHGMKNMVEVAVVSEIVKSLFKASFGSRQKLSVGVISPYKAQVFAIKEKLGDTYDTPSDFSVSVRTVDGFQGGEEDVIIISTVRSNGKGSVGFLANLQRTNVALTRARYCLWVLGNGPTLFKSGSIWRKLVLDAKDRGCFFNADKDESLKEAIIAGLVDLGEFDELLNMDYLLFGGARWKVLFSNDFWKSMAKLWIKTRKEVFALLVKLASGWRHPQKWKYLYLMDGISSELLNIYKVNVFNLVWTVDILRENFKFIQVLKIWDILPLQEIPKLAKRLDDVFGNYEVNDMSRCKFKCSEGKLEVPMSWEISNAATLMDLQEPKPLPFLSSRFVSLHPGKEPNASAVVYGDITCKTNDLAGTTRMKRRSHPGILKNESENSPISSIFCLKNNVSMEEFDQVEDCYILDFDLYGFVDQFEKLSLKDDDDAEELAVTGQRGQVACLDYPHSRHLCAKFPFDRTPREDYCEQCYCYVCDIIAPCKFWKKPVGGHCDATEHDELWKNLRDKNKPVPPPTSEATLILAL